MATYYVRTDGSDTNTGTGTGTGQAWATIGKALGSTGIASGDTVYIKPGTYAESVTIAVTPTATTSVIGDSDGAIFGSTGEVIWSGFTNGNDAAPTGIPCILNGKKYFTFRRITFYGDDPGSLNSSCINATTSVSTNLTLEQCVFHILGSSSGLRLLIPNNTSMYLTVDRCAFVGRGSAIYLDTRPGATGTDWNSEVDIKNCVFLNSNEGIRMATNQSNTTSRSSHGKVTNCLFYGADYAVRTNNAFAWATTDGMAVRNCMIYGNATNGLFAAVSGQITSDYNRFADNNVNFSLVTAGTNDILQGAYELDFGAGYIQGGANRAFWMPSQTINPSADTSIQPSTDIIGTTRTSTSVVGAYLDKDLAPATASLAANPLGGFVG